jgi:hypothetical protein
VPLPLPLPVPVMGELGSSGDYFLRSASATAA